MTGLTSRRLLVGLTTMTLIAATGCATRDTSLPTLPTLSAAGVARQMPATDAPVAAVAKGMTALGWQLARAGSSASTNWVASPLSIAYAFAMVRAGAGGETAAEIDRVFGFPPAGVHEAFNAVTRQVVTMTGPPPPRPKTTPEGDRPRPPVVCVGNGLFTDRGYPIGEQFLGTLAAQYGAGVHPVDFASPDTVKMINSWVRQQTADRITKLFDELLPDTRLVLANAVYLRADWAQPFEDPMNGTFTRADRSTVQVPMMTHEYGRLRYAAGDGWQAVEVPYAGGQLAMRIMLPSADRGPGQVLSPDGLLSPDVMAAAGAAMRPESVGLTMPSWDFGTEIKLKDVMRKLGVNRAFDPDAAEFSGINPELYIGDAVHRATITVDKSGTEAAAVTGLDMVSSSAHVPTVVMRVDRPFAFAIVHGPTATPLFVGHVADPSAH